MSVQVPVASARGRQVFAHACDRGDGPFACLECDGELVLARGPCVTAHFRHKSSAACNGESLAHRSAKLLLAHFAERFVFVESCSTYCGASVGGSEPLTFRGVAAQQEFAVGKFFVDVCLLRDDKPVLFIEVEHTHPVPQSKWEQIVQSAQCPLIEVRAQDVAAAYFDGWKLGFHFFDHTMCAACEPENAKQCYLCHERLPRKWMTHMSFDLHEHRDVNWYCRDTCFKHMLRWEKKPPHACATCGAKFVRRDALVRDGQNTHCRPCFAKQCCETFTHCALCGLLHTALSPHGVCEACEQSVSRATLCSRCRLHCTSPKLAQFALADHAKMAVYCDECVRVLRRCERDPAFICHACGARFATDRLISPLLADDRYHCRNCEWDSAQRAIKRRKLLTRFDAYRRV